MTDFGQAFVATRRGANKRLMFDQKKIAQAMKKMGIAQKELPVKQVIFVMDDSKAVFDNPNVVEVDMSGQKTYQITGEFVLEDLKSEIEFDQEDIETVMQQTDVSLEEAQKALKEENDIAKAILSLKKK